jgi:hypothetical protein
MSLLFNKKFERQNINLEKTSLRLD